MLLVGTPGDQSDLYIGDLGTGEDSPEPLFLQMCQDQPLPVPIQHIFAAVGIKDESGSRLTPVPLKKMDFRVVAQRFEMPDALNDLSDRFLIYNISFAKFDLHAESFPYLTFQDFHLYIAHDLCLDFAKCLVPDDMELRVFLLEHAHVFEHGVGVCSKGQQDPVGEDRL